MSQIMYFKNYNLAYLKSYLKSFLNLNQNGESSGEFLDIGILNPTIGTSNLGDYIIYESVYKNLRETYPKDVFTNFPTQLYNSFDTKHLMSQKDILFVAGTNLLASNLERRLQWKISQSHKRFLKNKVVLFGCGWWQYQGEINRYSTRIYKSILNSNLIHAARDNYTVEKFHAIGINNVVNTSCPTLWRLSPEVCRKIPTQRKDSVVTTLTSYNKNKADDLKMLELLGKNYETVFLWMQSYEDIQYLNELTPGIQNLTIIPPTLEAYDALLTQESIDYIGTRLHAGVRALQNNIRTLILAVDNRAIEIGEDTNLNVIRREQVEEISSFIEGTYVTNIKLPHENIQAFMNSLANYKLA